MPDGWPDGWIVTVPWYSPAAASGGTEMVSQSGCDCPCVQEKGCITVCDPAVGSGVMLLAFAKVVHAEMGRPALSKVRFYGTDIDQRCVLMCRIQLRMNGLDEVGRMAGLVGALEKATPTDSVTLTPGRQLMLPGVAA